jgi:putative Mn2+ efflux pump MntP
LNSLRKTAFSTTCQVNDMDMVTLMGTAIALAMDAFAVAVASGVSLKIVSPRQTFRLAWHFGFFQALMPIIGWSGGLTVRSLIEHYDHWVAFVLLALVGGHMIWEALEKEKKPQPKNDPTRGLRLVMLSVATSIDALAVGLSLSLLKISIWLPALVIGLVATIATAAGLHLGRKAGASSHLSSYAEITGGIVLIAIGLKVLYEHGVFSAIM